MEGQLISVGDNDENGEAEKKDDITPNEPDQDANFLSLPAFRMMCLSNPLLDTFFSSQLPASFQLEAPHRVSTQGTSIWHDIPSAATLPSSSSSSMLGSPRAPQNNAPSSAPAGASSFPTTAHSSPSSARTYSKDVSTGVVGRLGGFLNNFLGEEVKQKVDELADTLGEKLNTKEVRGPLPSFANLSDNSKRRMSSATLGMDDLRAMEEQRRERRRKREEEEMQEEEEAKKARDKKGIDISAAQESLRMATEAVVEGTQTGGNQFKEDVPVVAGEEDEEEDIAVEEIQA